MFVDAAAVYPRSAPNAWGAWPAEQTRFAEAARRAFNAIARVALDRGYGSEAIIEVWMHAPEDFAATYFGPRAETLVIGHILIRAAGRAWSIAWDPATGAGTLGEYRALLSHEVNRAVDGLTRVY